MTNFRCENESVSHCFDWPLTHPYPRSEIIIRTCAILERTSWAPRVPRRCEFRSGGCRDFPTIPFSVAAHSTAAQFSIPTPAANKTTDAGRDPSSGQRGHREGADKEGTLAAMNALWLELADPMIK